MRKYLTNSTLHNKKQNAKRNELGEIWICTVKPVLRCHL
jgi:hypothetical protein